MSTIPVIAETPAITPETPVSKETLTALHRLQETRLSLGERLLDLEGDKVRLLAAVQRLDSEKTRIFEALLIERGLPPNAVVEVDAATGIISDPRKRQAEAPTA